MAGKSYQILVVDDEALAIKLARRVFEPETDIEVLADTSPLRALELAKANDLDLVIADQRMPEMDGLHLLDRLREVRPRALRILLTAFPDTSVALAAINAGLVYRFILKPWEPEDMRITIRRALETKRLTDEHERVVRQLKTGYEELVEAEHLAALGRVSAGIGQELDHAVSPLLANVKSLETQLATLIASATEGGSAALTGRKAVESLATIRAAGERLEALVRTVAGYAVRGEPEPVDVNQSVLAAMLLLAPRFDTAIRLERDLQAVPRVRCRRSEMLQVVINLVANAIEAVERRSDPRVRVRTWTQEGGVRIEVADNGAGLDPAVEPRIFQPFVSTKAAGLGSGLGLSICRGIVENHGGSIEVESRAGAGTRFTVALPGLPAGP
ncbi:MAG: hypothetical protein NVSMB23_27050 [Myxococcales bacterium]